MKLIHFLKNIWTGGIVIRVSKYDKTGNAKSLGFPKIAPWMITLLTAMAFLQHIPLVLITLFPITAVVVFFGFFYYDVFKEEIPKTKEEAKKDIITIGFNRKEIVFEKTDLEKALEANDSVEYKNEVITEVESKNDIEIIPTMDNTKGEIIDYLHNKGIRYKKSDTKAKLLSKI